MFLLSSCRSKFPTEWDSNTTTVYIPDRTVPKKKEKVLMAQLAPCIVVQKANRSYNRVARPKAYEENGRIKLKMDPNDPVMFAEMRQFTTPKDTYSNYIYRVHFKKTPLFHMQSGLNTGLFVIVTCDSYDKPILVTTVSTSGRSVTFYPTNNIHKHCLPYQFWTLYPENRGNKPNTIYVPQVLDEGKITLFVSKDMHKIESVFYQDYRILDMKKKRCEIPVEPLENLEHLNLNGKEVSMYYIKSADGFGYVRQSAKPFEFFLMSWWTFDPRIGSDKILGATGDKNPRFYTTIKPWARKQSDMRDYHRFLMYWGWNL